MIRGYLVSIGVPIPPNPANQREGWVNIRCPFCNDHSNHLGINETSGIYNCWRCPARGPLHKLIMQLARVPFAEADRIAKSLVGSRPTFVERKRTYGKLPPIERWSYPILDAPKVVRMYVESRGLSLTELHARVEGCRFCWDLGPLDYRIIFPVIVNKQIVNYAGRDFMHRRVPKYKALSDDQALLNIDEVLFGIDDIKQNRNVVIVEGALDKVKLGIGAVASWGVSLSSAQVKLLREKHPNKVFILLDTEAVDRGVADAMMRQIWFANTTILRLTEYGDPGEIPVTEGAELMMRLAYV